MGAAVNLGSRAATFEDVKDVPAGQFNYGGSTTWAPNRGEIDPLLEAAWSSFDLTYVDPANQPASTQAGLEMLLAGELDFAQSSRPLTADEQQAGLVEIPVAVEGVAIATHPDLTIDSITLAQLKAIYTGQTTNWQAVGGPDLIVVPIARDAGGGTVQFFQTKVLEGAAFASTLQQANTTTEALRLVADTPGSLYFASSPEIVNQCTIKPLALQSGNPPAIPPYQPPFVPLANCPNPRNQTHLEAFESGRYPLTRPLYIVVRADQPEVGTAYAQLLISAEGQRLLGRKGFARLR
ncbi:MAG: substrate-binding domain-containing protein [Cyanobacteria bacterium J06648_16]